MSKSERFFLTADDVETLKFDWGEISMTVSPAACKSQGLTRESS